MKKLFKLIRLAYLDEASEGFSDVYEFTKDSTYGEIKAAVSQLYGQVVNFNFTDGGNYVAILVDPDNSEGYGMIGGGQPVKEWFHDTYRGRKSAFVVCDVSYKDKKKCQTTEIGTWGDYTKVIVDITNRTITFVIE